MDTIFRLVNLEQQHDFIHHHQQQSEQSFSSTGRTSSSSRSSHRPSSYHQYQSTYNQYHCNYSHNQQGVDEEECFNFFMDDEDLSSSSSKHQYGYNYAPHQPSSTANTPSNTASSAPAATISTPRHFHVYGGSELVESSYNLASSFNLDLSSSKWASDILLETVRWIANKNSSQLNHMMWMLNELGSPYGDINQKLASYFLQALFCRMTDSGERTYRTLSSASDKNCSFESTRKLILKFQEVSPWTTFGHVACNGAIMEALEGESKLHIVDISNTCCTQWPTLLEALATRTDETPHLRLTTVVLSRNGGDSSSGGLHKVMKEIGSRMEKFARLMGVPFSFNVIHHLGDLSEFNLMELDVREDEALVINCVGSLHSISPVANKRDYVISCFRRLHPRVITVVEDEADLDIGVDGHELLSGFQECLRWFRLYYEALEESFPTTSNERLMLERAAGRAMVDLLALPAEKSFERRVCAGTWSRQIQACGFSPVPFSDEVCDDVRALLRRYKEGYWSMVSQQPEVDRGQVAGRGLFLCWKDEAAVWASAWRPT